MARKLLPLSLREMHSVSWQSRITHSLLSLREACKIRFKGHLPLRLLPRVAQSTRWKAPKRYLLLLIEFKYA